MEGSPQVHEDDNGTVQAKTPAIPPEITAAAPPVTPPRRPDVPDSVKTWLEQYGSASGEFVVRIERAYPMEHQGHQFTVPLDENLTVDEIKRTCGGRVFRLKVYQDLDGTQKYVAMRTIKIDDVPRRNGVPLDPPDVPAAAPAAQPFGEVGSLVRELIQQQQASQDRTLKMFEKMLEMRFNSEGDSEPYEAPDPVERVAETLELIKSIQAMNPAAAAQGTGENEEMYLRLADRLFDRLDNKKDRKAGAPPKRQIVVRRTAPPPTIANPAPPAPATPAPTTSSSTTQNPTPETVAAMNEARQMSADRQAAPLAAVPNPEPTPEETVDDSSSDSESDVFDEEKMGADLVARIQADPDSAGLFLRDVFESIPPSVQMRLGRIITRDIDPSRDRTLDKKSTPDPRSEGEPST